MKKSIRILSIVLCLTLMAVCAPMTTFAVEYYDVSVAGVRVSSANGGDIFKDGTASYDPISNTLTLDNIKIDALRSVASGQTAGIICESSKQTFNIELIGDNLVDISNSGAQMLTFGVAAYGDLYIYGEGSLTTKSGPSASLGNYGLYSDKSITLANKGSICAEAGATSGGSARSYGICCYETGLIIDGPKSVEGIGRTSGSNKKATINIGENDSVAVYGQAGPEAGGTDVLDYDTFNTFDWCDVRYEMIYDYDVVVNGIRVNGANQDDVLGDGTVSYDDDMYTLSLANAKLDVPSTYNQTIDETTVSYDCIISSGHDLSIQCFGKNSITCEESGDNYFTNIFSNGYIEFLGAGDLEIYAPTNARMSACVFATSDVCFNGYGSIFICGADNTGTSVTMGVYSGQNTFVMQAAKNKAITIQGGTQAIFLGEVGVPYVSTDMTAYGCEDPMGTYVPVTLTEENYTGYKGLLFTGSAHVLQGDVNDDSFVDMKDVLGIRKYIAHIGSYINEIAADVNNDSIIDMKDVLLLRRIIISVG